MALTVDEGGDKIALKMQIDEQAIEHQQEIECCRFRRRLHHVRRRLNGNRIEILGAFEALRQNLIVDTLKELYNTQTVCFYSIFHRDENCQFVHVEKCDKLSFINCEF